MRFINRKSDGTTYWSADPIKRVLEQCRAKEATFQEEHDGMSSAEYYNESGYSDAQDEAMREREEIE